MAVAGASFSAGTSAKDRVASEVNCSARVSPPTASTAKIAATGQAGVKAAQTATPKVASTPFATKTRRKPKRFRSGRTSGFIAKAPSAVAAVTKPLALADRPKTICSFSGSRKGRVEAPMRKRLPPPMDAPKLRSRNSARSTAGLRARSEWRSAKPAAAAPAASIAGANQAGAMPRPSVSIPAMRQASAAPHSTSPFASSGPGSWGSTSGMKRQTSSRPSRPTGMFSQNTARQEKASVSRPPTGGPKTGPSRPGMVSQVMAVTSSSLLTRRSSSRRPTGTIIAPPTPCRMRAATSEPRPCASPTSAEAMVKTAIASMKTRRAPKRSATQPDTGMKTHSATR